MRGPFVCWTLSVAACAFFAADARSASLDPSFAPVLRDFGSSSGFSASRTSTVQADGKILVGGRFTVANGVARSGVARFHADYTLDPSFDAGDFSLPEAGVYVSSGGTVNVIRVQADGKILVGGGFRRGDDPTRRTLERLNADGSTDASFAPAPALLIDGEIGDMEIQPDGKIVVGGTFEVTTTNPSTGQPVTFLNLARINPDGTFDFGFTGYAWEFSDNIVLQPDGKIVVGNSRFAGPPGNGIAVRRYNANGTFESTLATVTDGFGIEALEQLPDGKFLVAGDINYIDNVFRRRIARLNANGGLDPTFEVVDTLNGSINDLFRDGSGNILIVGDFYIYDGVVTQYYVARLSSTGARDTSFNIERRISGIPVDVNLLPDGRFLLAGALPVVTDVVNFNTFYDGLAVVNNTGDIDESLRINFSVTEQGGVFDTAQQPDGKIVLAGEFQYAENEVRRSVVRYHADGSLDLSFDPMRNISVAQSIAPQPDGKILVAHGGASILLQRLNPDGSIDTSFTPPFVAFSASIQARTRIQVVLLQPDGKILVGGKLITGSASSPTLSGLVRLNTDGTRDTTFQIVFARGGTNYINDLALQPDGKIVFGGDFTNISNDTSRAFLGRVNADGTLDPDFHPFPPGLIYEIELQTDGRILFGGAFGSLQRVNADGTPDGLNVPVNETISALALEPNGHILLGGRFTSVNGGPAQRLARLTSDGAVDPTFNLGANSTVYDISLQNDGRILFGGQFTRINGLSRIGAARTGAAVLPSAVVSRKIHGNAGVYEIPLPLTGARGIESRLGPVPQSHQIVFRFASAVTVASVEAWPGGKDKSVSVASMGGGGTAEITVDLGNVTDAQVVSLILRGVSNGGGANDITVPIGILAGDVNGNGVVNASDLGTVKAQSGQSVGAANFRADGNTSGGGVNASDVALVKSKAGNALP